jgi:hypothetical protein
LVVSSVRELLLLPPPAPPAGAWLLGRLVVTVTGWSPASALSLDSVTLCVERTTWPSGS